MSLKSEGFESLCWAIAAAKTHGELQSFLRDLCTPKELDAMVGRWQVCRLLNMGQLSYREIHRITGISLVTIGRISRCLNENGGYKKILNYLERKE
ncbi:MAG: trp operon repressor [Puniceicoccales bacterium]|jgi:TrpR-related protein YerC/YecD|nr:trp operon repressor [Puniceicoccales bacterium]